jgi:hypothetical protein
MKITLTTTRKGSSEVTTTEHRNPTDATRAFRAAVRKGAADAGTVTGRTIDGQDRVLRNLSA